MKAKDLVNVELGRHISVPWDSHSSMNGELEEVKVLDGGEVLITLEAGISFKGIRLKPNDEVTVFGGEPVPAIDGEAIQFVNDPDTVRDIAEFIGGSGSKTHVTEWPSPCLSAKGNFWKGSIFEGDWLVKRNDKVVKLTDDQYQILFGDE